MERRLYYILDENFIVIGTTDTTGFLDGPNIIEATELDEGNLGKKYENGEFIDVEIEE